MYSPSKWVLLCRCGKSACRRGWTGSCTSTMSATPRARNRNKPLFACSDLKNRQCGERRQRGSVRWYSAVAALLLRSAHSSSPGTARSTQACTKRLALAPALVARSTARGSRPSLAARDGFHREGRGSQRVQARRWAHRAWSGNQRMLLGSVTKAMSSSVRCNWGIAERRSQTFSLGAQPIRDSTSGDRRMARRRWARRTARWAQAVVWCARATRWLAQVRLHTSWCESVVEARW
jgi:hypothetical protein